jgi:DNA-directed RNA polymerase subunit RPC12/RpoP
MLTVSCPQCSNKMRAPDESAGKKAKCGKCGHKFLIEASQPSGEDLPLPNSPKTRPLPHPEGATQRPLSGVFVAPPRSLKRRLVIWSGLAGLVLAIACISIFIRIWAKAPTPQELQRLAALKDKRDHIAAEFEAAAAEYDRFAPEKVRSFFEGRMRIRKAHDQTIDLELEGERAKAQIRRLEEEFKRPPPENMEEVQDRKREADRNERADNLAALDRKEAAAAKAQAVVEGDVKEARAMSAARESAASKMQRLQAELETMDRQIEEWPK